MVYIPFVSLLGFQAALSPFTPKSKTEPVSTNVGPAVPFVNPNLHGGSLLDLAPNTNGLGEPLNVSISQPLV